MTFYNTFSRSWQEGQIRTPYIRFIPSLSWKIDLSRAFKSALAFIVILEEIVVVFIFLPTTYLWQETWELKFEDSAWSLYSKWTDGNCRECSYLVNQPYFTYWSLQWSFIWKYLTKEVNEKQDLKYYEIWFAGKPYFHIFSANHVYSLLMFIFMAYSVMALSRQVNGRNLSGSRSCANKQNRPSRSKLITGFDQLLYTPPLVILNWFSLRFSLF